MMTDAAPSNALTGSAVSPPATPRLRREDQTFQAMLRIYCRDHHEGGRRLCPQCQSLLDYSRLRLERCVFGEDKPTCARCPIHCYQTDRRAQVRDVMRYSGPRMLRRHPFLALRHLLKGRRPVPAVPGKKPAIPGRGSVRRDQ